MADATLPKVASAQPIGAATKAGVASGRGFVTRRYPSSHHLKSSSHHRSLSSRHEAYGRVRNIQSRVRKPLSRIIHAYRRVTELDSRVGKVLSRVRKTHSRITKLIADATMGWVAAKISRVASGKPGVASKCLSAGRRSSCGRRRSLGSRQKWPGSRHESLPAGRQVFAPGVEASSRVRKARWPGANPLSEDPAPPIPRACRAG